MINIKCESCNNHTATNFARLPGELKMKNHSRIEYLKRLLKNKPNHHSWKCWFNELSELIGDRKVTNWCLENLIKEK